jgi:MFS family permease
VGILILYTAFNSASNLQSLVMNEDGFGQLGFYILAVLYFFMGIGSLISTAIINRYGTKFCLILGGTGNTIWIVTMILVAHKQQNSEPSVF